MFSFSIIAKVAPYITILTNSNSIKKYISRLKNYG